MLGRLLAKLNLKLIFSGRDDMLLQLFRIGQESLLQTSYREMIKSELRVMFVGLSALFLLAGLAACGSDHKAFAQLSEPHYASVSVRQVSEQSVYQVPREFIGVVQAPQRTNIAFDASGSLVALFVEEGDTVVQGQPLAQLDTSVLDSQLANAKAAKRELDVRLALNKKDLARLQKLREKNYAAESQEDSLASQRESLKAQIDAARASINTLEQQLKKKTLVAPFAATVAGKTVDQGAVISQGMVIMQLLEAGSLEFRVGVPVRMARKLNVGDMHAVLIEGREHAAKVKTIGARVDFASKTIAVELELVNSTGNLFDGQIARLVLNEQREQSGVWVSVDSLVAGARGSWDVYILSELTEDLPQSDGDDLKMVERRKVNVEYIGGGGAFISYGLSTGEWVVDSGIHKIAVGQLVKIGKQVNIAELDRLEGLSG